MKKIKILSLLFWINFLFPSLGFANDLIKSLTNGECTTHACMTTYNIKSLTNGECTTHACMTTYNIKSLTNGECTTHACMTAYNARSLSNGECTTQDCLKKYLNKSLGLPENYSGPYAYTSSYNYDVSGYGDGGYVSGNIDASGDRYVDGYLTLDDGTQVSFDGEWTGKGEIEGYDENGNFYELEVD